MSGALLLPVAAPASAQIMLPSDTGVVTWTLDPATASGTSTPATGTMLLAAFVIRGIAQNVSVIGAYVNAAGSGLASGENYAGIYSASSGNLIAQTADQSTSWNTSTVKTMALTGAPVSLSPGRYFAALLVNATGVPTFLGGSSTGGPFVNINTTGGAMRFGTYGSSLTSLPASLTLASIATTPQKPSIVLY